MSNARAGVTLGCLRGWTGELVSGQGASKSRSPGMRLNLCRGCCFDRTRKWELLISHVRLAVGQRVPSWR